jgi:hypothetical protein
MKPSSLRLLSGLLALVGLAPRLAAQDATPAVPPATPPGATPPAATNPTRPAVAATPRFTTFDLASPAVQTAVQNAQQAAASARQSIGPAVANSETGVARAVSQASAAIVQEGRVARAELLAERQAALVRLRLAQSAAERVRLVSDLRARTGLRLEEQRETARLVRDRLRELRDTTALTPKPGGG